MRSLAAKSSERSAMNGSMTDSSRPAAARSKARTCVRNIPGLSSDIRIARHPSAGFSS